MPGNHIRVPILTQRVYRWLVYEVELLLEIRSSQGRFVALTFLFDTGTQFSTISSGLARQMGISFSVAKPVGIRGASGKGQGFLSPVWFSFPQLPQWQFESLCCFSSTPLPRSLVSLSDLVSRFTLQTLRPSPIHPNGSLVLRLRPDHNGQPRP